MKYKTGDKVVMTTAEIKRNLSNWMYEAHCFAGNLQNESQYDSMVQMSMLAAMKPLVGTVTGYGNDCVKVQWKVSGLCYEAYCEYRSVRRTKGS